MKNFKRIFAAALLVVSVFAWGAYALDFSDLAADMMDTPKERVRLGILSFTSKAYGVPDGMAAGISDFFARLLFKADDIMLVERERLDDVARELRLGMSGLVDPKSAAEIGKLAGADYMLLGSITNLGHGASGGYVPLPFVSLSVNQQKVKADLDVRVVKVETGEIVFAEGASGEASQSSTGLATQWFGVTDTEFSGIEGNAIFNATAKLAPAIQKALTGRDSLTTILQEEFKKALKGSKKTAKADSKEKKTTSTKKRKAKKSEETPAVVEPSNETPAAADTPAATEPEPEPEPSNVSAASATPEPAPAPDPEPAPETDTGGFENHSTDPGKVIPTYNLSSGEKNTLRIRHLNLRQYGKKKKAYDEFVKLYEEYNGDYLAAYKAGEVAQALRDNENAAYWYEKALEVNPNYEPAQKAKDKLSSAPARPASKKRRK
ncbi:MAG: hypothetical protein IJU31_06580 [Synergistaceae bacterium]|nr:hypothetical protein [Synergistaceae bacterium]